MLPSPLLRFSLVAVSLSCLSLPAPAQTVVSPANGAYRIGAGVSAPTVVYKIDPEFTEEARKAHFQGTVLLSVVVDAEGQPRDIKVVRALGLGLDQKAIEAVERWRFRPGMKDGQPVAVSAQIEVSFRLLNGPQPAEAMPVPTDARGYLVRGTLYAARQEYNLAIQDFTQAITMKPDGVDAYVGRGNAYLGLHQVPLAIDDFTSAIRLNPADYKAYRSRGQAYVSQRDYDQSVRDFTQAIQMNPDAQLYLERSFSYLAQQQKERALADLDEAIRLYPYFAKAYEVRRSVRKQVGDTSGAEADEQKLQELSRVPPGGVAKQRAELQGVPRSGVIGGILSAVPPAPPPPAGTNRIRVGENVQAANLVRKVPPEYPTLARQARIQGTVRFDAIIGKDGTIQNLQVITGHPMLIPPAQEAVKQWVYKPTLLNGEPVEVVTRIDVNFVIGDTADGQHQ